MTSSRPGRTPPAPEPRRSAGPGEPASGGRRQTLELLSRVLEEGVVIARGGGDVVSMSDPAVALLGGPGGCEAAWAWLHERLRARAAGSGTGGSSIEGRFVLDLELPDHLGGARVRCSVHPQEEDADGRQGLTVLLKDRRSIDWLQTDLQLALRVRRRGRRVEQAAHDLKAPLNALALNLDLLRRELRAAGALDDAEARLGVLQREISRLHRLVEAAMSQFRVPEEGVRRLDLRQLVGETAELIGPQADSAEVAVELDLPATPVWVHAVRDHLEQALLNLLVNGLEAMSVGGLLEIALCTRDGTAELRIRDDGPGIPEAIARHVFDLHFSTKPTGSGLGLFISRSIVEGLDGRLELESAAGRGTTAVVRLPIGASAAPAPAAPDAEPDSEATCSTS